jgi:hypothetical protein
MRFVRTLGALILTALVGWTSGRGESLSTAGDEGIVLEDFEVYQPGAFPAGWDVRSWGEIKSAPYWVAEEGGNRFLRAEDSGQNVILVKPLRWDLRDYPYLSWRWRIRAVPTRSDERYEDLADSAAGLYLTYRKRIGLIPQSVKFVWSAALPKGSAFRRSGVGMPWAVVVGSGADLLNTWHRFEFNVLEAYRRTFGGEPPSTPLGIGILSDANNTRTRAFADYDDIGASRRAHSPERILQILAAQ